MKRSSVHVSTPGSRLTAETATPGTASTTIAPSAKAKLVTSERRT